MNDPNKYQRCMVMGGGGFRFPYYLGMHAAAADAGKAPDVLLASCGGALAAAIIHRLPDDAARLAFAQSEAMYTFVRSIASTPRAAPGRALLRAARSWLRRSPAPVVPDLFNDYLFALPPVLPLPPPLPPAGAGRNPALAIVGARLLFGADQVGQPRAGRKLFMQTVFGDTRTCALLAGMGSPVTSDAVARELALVADVALEDAVRSSIADMVYFRCHRVGTEHYAGGVIDLMPIELAHRVAHRVIVEIKPPFNQVLAIPALREVFGIDGNARMDAVHAHAADIKVDTSDMSEALAGLGVSKRIDWNSWRLVLDAPADYATFVANVQCMWSYGYARARDALSLPMENTQCA